MSSPPRSAASPTVAPATIVVGLCVALFALLLLKWLAVVALAALALAGLVWWARRDPSRPLRTPRTAGPAAQHAAARPAPVAPRVAADDDCSWCGLPGGHRDLDGRPVRPRHVHRVA